MRTWHKRLAVRLRDESGAVAFLRHRALVDDHPQDTEPVAELSVAGGEEGLLHGRVRGAAVGECGVDALGFGVAVHAQREIGAFHGFEQPGRGIAGHEHVVSQVEPGMEHGLGLFRRHRGRVGHLAIRHEALDFGAEVLLVILKGLGAVGVEEQVGVHLHVCLLPGEAAGFINREAARLGRGGPGSAGCWP